MKSILLSVIAAWVNPAAAATMSVQVLWYNYTQSDSDLKDIKGIPLTSGTSASGDGAVLQLGYYTASTATNPFGGVWVPMTGPGTARGSTIGDFRRLPAGQFDLFSRFTANEPNLPPVGTLMCIRFYDSTSLETANYFNCVSNTGGRWNWIVGDPEPILTLAFKQSPSTLVWQGGPDSAYRTTIIVPEPGVALLVACAALLPWHRRRV